MNETVLIFPAAVPEALAFARQAAARGETVIGSSSLRHDPARADYEHWERLPFVHDEGFGEALVEVLRRRRVSAIFAPHDVIFRRLSERLSDVAPQVRLIARPTSSDREDAYRRLRMRALAPPLPIAACSPARPALSPLHRAGLLRLVDTIPGMTDDDKIAALIEVARHAPEGDIVEIGSWWGRSAALLLLLSQAHDIGPVLCVDPWSDDGLVQGVDLVDRASAAMDPEEALRIFEINLHPLARGDLNYLRLASVDAAARYRPGLDVRTEAFGRTRYGGEIALLHIDGNHTAESAAADVEAWTGFVRPGGWIVVDDYVWAFGDGPRRAGDAFLERAGGQVAAAFVTGTALFLQLAGRAR
jgi:hypothetical protein